MDKDNNTYLIAGSIIIAGFIVAVGIMAAGNGGSSNVAAPTGGDTAAEIDIEPVSSDDHIVGNPDADLTIIEFSDTECPYCKRFHGTMNDVMDEYGDGGRVAWVYRHFPIPQLHQKAVEEAHALECAAELGGNEGFWTYANRLYDITPSNDGLDLEELPKIAEYAELDVAAFEECQESGRYMDIIDEDTNDAIASGGRGTPHNVFLTKSGVAFPAPGAMPEAMVTDIIDTILASIDAGDEEDTMREKVSTVFARYQ